MTFEEYSEKFENEFGRKPRVPTVNKAGSFDMPHSEGRVAYGNVSWMDYYRTFADKHMNAFKCPACGKEIFVDLSKVDATVMSNLMKKWDKDSPDAFKAHGAHIKFGSSYYIVPLCPECNNPANASVELPLNTVVVEELGATVDNED